MPTHAFTIAKLADAAGIGIEAVRYYQRRGLLEQPRRIAGGFREYALADVQRLQFVKRAQELGFSLDDVAELVSLSADRNRSHVREIAQRRVVEIRQHVRQLEALANALQGLVGCCEQSAGTTACPIIDALAEPKLPARGLRGASPPSRGRSRRGHGHTLPSTEAVGS